MPARRLQDRIREPSARALYEMGPSGEEVVHHLQLAIHEHALQVNNKTTAATVGGRPEVFIERRKD